MKTMTVKDLLLAGIILGKFAPEDFIRLANKDKNIVADDSKGDRTISFNKGYENIFFYIVKYGLDNGLGKVYKSTAEFESNIHNIFAEHFRDIQMYQLFRIKTNSDILKENLIMNGKTNDETVFENLGIAGFKALIDMNDIIREPSTENVTEEQIRELEIKLNNRGGLQCLENMMWN